MRVINRRSFSRFNPRACVRRDVHRSTVHLPLIGFQSTRLREARLGTRRRPDDANYGFNPRACVRRDRHAAPSRRCQLRFQSTRLREARRDSVFLG